MRIDSFRLNGTRQGEGAAGEMIYNWKQNIEGKQKGEERRKGLKQR